mmetsp:Transcript_62940/g.174461  ORF Transcript_62940/g.174461 Transcript_62940/m.174461 type:complete len:263 (+) Transcript_62940:1042-1830(+)
MPDKADDLRPGEECLPYVLVDDHVQVALPEPNLLVLQALVVLGQHVQAGGKQLDLPWEDGELAAVGLAHKAPHAHDVASVDHALVPCEVFALIVVRLAHDLHTGAIGPEVIEEELRPRGALVPHAAADDHDLVLPALAGGQVLVLLDERRDGDVYAPLVRVRVLQGLEHRNPVFPVLGRIEVLQVPSALFALGLCLGGLLGLLPLLLLRLRLGLRLLLQPLALSRGQLVGGGGLRHGSAAVFLFPTGRPGRPEGGRLALGPT